MTKQETLQRLDQLLEDAQAIKLKPRTEESKAYQYALTMVIWHGTATREELRKIPEEMWNDTSNQG